MTDTVANGQAAQPTAHQPTVQARIVAQYIKDLSFENPNVERMIEGPGENPNLKLEINVNARRAKDDMYESAIDFKASAVNSGGVIYVLEVVYAAMFKIEKMPSSALEPFLLIKCPSIVFPFLRRLVADVTREGGFPPLYVDPIDFAALYVRRQQQAKAGITPPAPANDTSGS